jgi:glycosyltransferase involved in cell wall biosynthesis
VLLVLVGGRDHEIRELRERASKLGLSDSQLVLTGQVEHELAAKYLQAADALVIPDTVTQMTASPLKLFEYMAAGKPVVLKDMPALREILEDESGVFFPAGSVEALAAAIMRVKQDPERARQLAEGALRRSEQYTYAARAARIAEVVEACR